jgi:hypothetical protein
MLGYDWIYLAQGRDRWRALVNELISHRDPEKAGNFLTSTDRVSSPKRDSE